MRKEQLIRQMIEQVREELEYGFEDYDQWLYGLSINTKELERIVQVVDYSYVITSKIIIKTADGDLVDGTLINFDIELASEGHQAHIDLDFLEEEPYYQAGSIEDAIKWLSQDSYAGGKEIVYLAMRDEKLSSYKSY